MIPVTTFAGKTAAVFGLGASGVATALALLAGGASVAAWDDSEASRAAAEKAGVPIVDLSKADWSRFAALVLAPGVPLTHPEPHWTVKAAKAAGIEVIGDIELFCRERRLQPFDVPFIAITGTNGKSTTTALIAHILREGGLDVQMGGNIGTPILALEPFALGRHYVIECSSFQIDLTPSIEPSVGVLLNLTPDHLDRHGTMENYAAIKERVVASADDPIVSNDDPWCRATAGKIDETTTFVELLSTEHKLANGWWVEQANLMVSRPHAGGDNVVAGLSGIGTLRGKHNAQNALAAVIACNLLGLDAEDIQRGLSTFPGLPHRMEEIGRLGRALFINDSKATNADSTEKALLSWERDIYWIAGGRPKEGGIASLVACFPRVAKAYLIGEATEEFAKTLSAAGAAFERCGTFDRAVASAARDAAKSAGAEPVVLLSPACASYDQFKNFEDRGEAFRRLVSELAGVVMRTASRVTGENGNEIGGAGATDLASPPPSLPRKGGGTASSETRTEPSLFEGTPSKLGETVPPPLWGSLGGGKSRTPDEEEPSQSGEPAPDKNPDDSP